MLYDFNAQRINYEPTVTAASLPQISRENTGSTVGIGDAGAGDGGIYPEQRPVYTQVKAGVGSKTQVHAVLDYDNDNDEYYEGDEENTSGKPGRNMYHRSYILLQTNKIHLIMHVDMANYAVT